MDVDVKNGPLTEVMAQLSRSAGIKVTADPGLSAGLVATVGLHGIPLQSALELVAGQTGLQISPRPDGVAFVTPGLSLDAAQSRMPRAPSRAKRVEQGQLWTAEWVHVLTSGFSAFDESNALRSLRRQTVNPDGRPLAFEPRSGSLHRLAPAARGPAPALPRPPPAHRLKSKDAGKQSAHPSTRSVACPHCGQLVPLKAGLKCAACGRVLTPGTRRCPACGGKPVRAILMPARCPHCREPLGRRQVRTG